MTRAMGTAIDTFLDHAVWSGTHRARLVPVAERADVVSVPAGAALLEQLHPAEHFWLLADGAVGHRTRGEDAWPLGHVDWPLGAIGWSGFLPPQRYGTSALAETDATLLRWRHDELATCFYADPGLAVDFLRLVADSVRKQLEAVRAGRVASAPSRAPLGAGVRSEHNREHRFAPGLLGTLRRSTFFEQFGDDTLAQLAREACPVRFEAGRTIATQDERLGGLWVLADGATTSFFVSAAEPDRARVRFRSILRGGAIAAGVPDFTGDYVAEATVVATQTCWLYRLDAGLVERLIGADPELGRAYMQRCLARLAQLLSGARSSRPVDAEEPEITAVKAVLAQNQTRLPVTSELHKVPHLLSHRLTTPNAFACLRTASEAGRYEERAVARTCEGLLDGVRAELEFYRDVLDAYVAVVEAPAGTDMNTLRLSCDRDIERAFAHLDTHVDGLDRLPAAPGHVFIMNHLACPAHYELPNAYHFSFDTAFVSMLLAQAYGDSPVRVVRRSPEAEYGHDLFYTRLGHLTVPTIESDETDAAVLEALRRDAAERFLSAGAAHLEAGRNVMICPEGASQRAEDSPARFFTGAFRLAQRAGVEPLIVPIAVAGFERRYKDARLTAVVQPPFKLSDAMAETRATSLREFVDGYRHGFAGAVRRARQSSDRGAPVRAAGIRNAVYRPSSAEII